jgi:hypothetical protein
LVLQQNQQIQQKNAASGVVIAEQEFDLKLSNDMLKILEQKVADQVAEIKTL